MRLSFSTPEKTVLSLAGRLAQLAVMVGQSENFEQFTSTLKDGLQAMGLEGCFLVSCFGFNRETRFGHWLNRYVFPLRSDLSEKQAQLFLRENLIVVRSGYFTLLVGHAAELQLKEAGITSHLLLFGEAARLWVQGYTDQVNRDSHNLSARKIGCKQLLDVVEQLDNSGLEMLATHRVAVDSLNSGVSQAIAAIGLTDEQQRAVCDEFDEVARAYSIFTKQQMDLNRQLKEQVRSIAGLLLSKEHLASKEE